MLPVIYFFTCALPLVVIEGFSAILPRLKFINVIFNLHYQTVELYSF